MIAAIMYFRCSKIFSQNAVEFLDREYETKNLIINALMIALVALAPIARCQQPTKVLLSSKPKSQSSPCSKEQLDLFSCVIQENSNSVGLCLDKSTLQISLRQKETHRQLTSEKLSNIQESALDFKGDSIVFQASSVSMTLQLFVDINQFDRANPLFVSAQVGTRKLSECKANTVRIDNEVLSVHGKQLSVGLFGLSDTGIVSQVKALPNWPESP
jgi:hypothetical protein